MDTFKEIATISIYAVMGATVGRLVDAISLRIFDSFDWDGPAIRVAAQGWGGIAVLANIASTLGDGIVVSDTTGSISAMW